MLPACGDGGWSTIDSQRTGIRNRNTINHGDDSVGIEVQPKFISFDMNGTLIH